MDWNTNCFINSNQWQDDQDDMMKKFTPLPDERTDAGIGGGKWKIEQYSGRPETAKCKKKLKSRLTDALDLLASLESA